MIFNIFIDNTMKNDIIFKKLDSLICFEFFLIIFLLKIENNIKVLIWF